MRKILGLAVLTLLLGAVAPAVVSAHPLGNFTVSRYSRIEPAGDGVRIVYVLDMAEIPTFQEQPSIDADRDGQVGDEERERYLDARAEELRRGLQLTLGGAPADLRLVSRSLSFPPGEANLPTMRIEAVYDASLPGGAGGPIDLVYRDTNGPTRIGWREIVARPAAAGTDVQRSSVPADDLTDELRRYPDDLLSSPLDVREARLTFTPGAAAADPLATAGIPIAARTRDVFASLAVTDDLSLPSIAFLLALAMVLGAGHALSPGHGKTVVAAYLVGSRGTAKHALFLGLTVTATHTAGVYALGLVTLYLSQYILPERLYPILEVVSGLLVIGIGLWLFVSRLRLALAYRARSRGLGDASTRTHASAAHSAAQTHAAAHRHDHGAANGHHGHHAHDDAVVLASAPALVGLRTRAAVDVRDDPAGHGHGAPHDHDHAADHGHQHDHDHGHADDHGHDHDHGHEEAHDHGHEEAHDHGHEEAHDHDHEQAHDHDHGHAHDHDHGHAHDHGNEPAHDHPHPDDGALVHSHGGRPHSHLPPGVDGQPVSWRSLLALGVSGGLVPCPSALVVLLSAIALHRVLFGLVLIVAFSIGLAAVLVGIGLLLVYARRFLERLDVRPSFATRLVPAISALGIVVAGVLITLQALPGLT